VGLWCVVVDCGLGRGVGVLVMILGVTAGADWSIDWIDRSIHQDQDKAPEIEAIALIVLMDSGRGRGERGLVGDA
jgi:hypothetical protein